MAPDGGSGAPSRQHDNEHESAVNDEEGPARERRRTSLRTGNTLRLIADELQVVVDDIRPVWRGE